MLSSLRVACSWAIRAAACAAARSGARGEQGWGGGSGEQGQRTDSNSARQPKVMALGAAAIWPPKPTPETQVRACLAQGTGVTLLLSGYPNPKTNHSEFRYLPGSAGYWRSAAARSASSISAKRSTLRSRSACVGGRGRWACRMTVIQFTSVLQQLLLAAARRSQG